MTKKELIGGFLLTDHNDIYGSGEPGPPGESAYNLIIEASNGHIFKNGKIETVLKARVFKGGEEITDILNASQFKWSRVSEDSVGDTIWNGINAGGTKTMAITKEDVFVRATFFCEIKDI